MSRTRHASAHPLNLRPASHAAGEEPPTALALEMRWNALLGQQDLLREEIKRGKESLRQAQTSLTERRSMLDEWPTYEKRCGTNCLPALTASVSADERIELFLTGWLERRQAELDTVTEAIAAFAREHGFGYPG
jgi:hypothetical protein